ncbi:MAG: hypothetical protein ACRC28_08495, partial [Clostridium sp.]|uniref:hypothetical protein n=1 Tax=Clostridium sp. TaxID=1506 RepID=UPI003F357B8D
KSNLIKLNEFSSNILVLSDEEQVLKEASEFLARPKNSEEEILKDINTTLYTFYFKNAEYIELPWFMKAIDLINIGHYDILESMALDENSSVYITPRIIKSEIIIKTGLSLFTKNNLEGYTMPKDKLMVIN